MKTEINNLECGRENDLIGFLYGELDPMEKQNFQLHMQECAECGLQLSSFSDIRESVVSWRNETLGAFAAEEYPPVARIDEPKPSAMAALREFFNLSPLWLKGTVAFASLLFCLFTVLAAARLMKPAPELTVVNKTSNQAPTAQELNFEVERRVKEELQRREAVNKKELITTNDSSANEFGPRPLKRQNQLASSSPKRKAGRPLSKVEREELAADLRLVADESDAELVLIGDRINQ